MSKYSGKCDFYDHVWEDIDKYINFNIYLDNSLLVPLKIESEKDLACFYPYLVKAQYYNKDNKGCIWLSKEPYIDREERERLTIYLNAFIKYYKKCKRKKIPYIAEEAVDHLFWYDPTVWIKEMARRVGEDGQKATINGIHLPLHQIYRAEWYKELVRLGHDPERAWLWVYHEFRSELVKHKHEEKNNDN